MAERWDDDELLGRLAAALRAADAVPRDFVEAAKTAYAWHGIDAELAVLAYDSAQHEEDLALTRADTAHLHSLTFRSAELTIEIEVTERTLVGQLVPPRPGTVRIWAESGWGPEMPVDEVGGFTITKPVDRFRLWCRCPGIADVITTWATV
ncbi:hypothetical protein GCM10009555_069890 [Acrocarpospora macrocephala]|uniref:Uncharacterized protein n=1 Tax=Acrocarpospora macrocephala TaxID=150177 RepID=A0A5M3X4N4_9ACTN|nr:hypothetical protein [Acrocarpospora macrocephala]GES13098.1 hypothetical protein Amac_066950 [Acrocarpospora macrocephala]